MEFEENAQFITVCSYRSKLGRCLTTVDVGGRPAGLPPLAGLCIAAATRRGWNRHLTV